MINELEAGQVSDVSTEIFEALRPNDLRSWSLSVTRIRGVGPVVSQADTSSGVGLYGRRVVYWLDDRSS